MWLILQELYLLLLGFVLTHKYLKFSGYSYNLFSSLTVLFSLSTLIQPIKYYLKAKKSPKCLALAPYIQLTAWHLHLEFNRQLKLNLSKFRLLILPLPVPLHFYKWYNHSMEPKSPLIPPFHAHLPSNPSIGPIDSITTTSPNPITSLHPKHHYPHLNHYLFWLRCQNLALSYSGYFFNVNF